MLPGAIDRRLPSSSAPPEAPPKLKQPVITSTAPEHRATLPKQRVDKVLQLLNNNKDQR
ncbi:hypothetical protein ABVT39_022402 [Epinephelus coioides]